MNQILDHTQDLSGSEQHRLTSLYTPPEFVKTASHDQLCGDSEELPPHVYAHNVQRVFPCHTKAATWMSALFFGDKRSEFSESQALGIAQNLLKSASYWNIKDEVNDLWTKMAADEQAGMTRIPDSDYAFVWEVGGRKERHYPLRNAVEVKQASVWFGDHHGDFRFEDKHKIAQKILEKAAATGAALENQDLLDRCAGFGYCAAEAAAQAWEKRATLTRRQYPEYATQAKTVAVTLRNATFEARDQGRRIKMASLMEDFDTQTQLDRLYGEGLERPEEVLFQVTEKVASDFLSENVTTTTGAIYEKTALQKVDIDTVRSWMGDDMADEVGGVHMDIEKLAEIVPTLPRPEAEMFEKMTSSLNIPVFAREKSASEAGISLADARQMAEHYQPLDQPVL